MRTLVLILLVLAAAVFRVAAEETPSILPPLPPTLEQQLEALDQTDAELLQLDAQRLAATTPTERQSLEAQRLAVAAFQAELLKAIEQAVGPLPPPAAPAAPAPARSALEQQLEQQRPKDETLLDRAVIRN